MGSGAANEAIHSVTLDPYWIDKTEVNNYQYKQCVAEQRCEPPKLHIGFDGDAQPVVGVTWDKAKQYCLWIGGDLPTEAQWEYAARGPQNYIYPWGNHFDYKWTNTKGEEDGYNGTAPVNSFEQGASWVGALNMAGNVYEWVNDWFDDDYYGYSPPLNPPGPAEGQLKVERGGDWYADPNLGTPEQIVQATKRAATDPHGDDNRVGFRCVVAINN
jgi:formylglycine-generating enzyme required for sulfatase activity